MHVEQKRIDRDGRDVTGLTGLWDESDTLINRRSVLGYITAVAVILGFSPRNAIASQPEVLRTYECIEMDGSMPEFKQFLERQMRYLSQRAANFAMLHGLYVKSFAFNAKTEPLAEFTERIYLECFYSRTPCGLDRFANLPGCEKSSDYPQTPNRESQIEAANRCGITLSEIGIP